MKRTNRMCNCYIIADRLNRGQLRPAAWRVIFSGGSREGSFKVCSFTFVLVLVCPKQPRRDHRNSRGFRRGADPRRTGGNYQQRDGCQVGHCHNRNGQLLAAAIAGGHLHPYGGARRLQQIRTEQYTGTGRCHDPRRCGAEDRLRHGIGHGNFRIDVVEDRERGAVDLTTFRY